MTIELPKHLSYSQVTTMLHCGEQWRLQRGLGLPENPSWAAVGGTAVHEGTEVIDAADLQPDNVRDIFNACFDRAIEAELKRYEGKFTKADFRASGRASKQWPDKEDEKWWRANGPAFVGAWGVWRRNSPMDLARDSDGKPYVELEITIELAGLPAKVIIDRVMTSAQGLVIVDIKSGANMPKYPMQLGVYARALETIGLRAKWGQFWDARQGVSGTSYDLDEWTKQRLDYTFGGVRKMQEQQIFIPNPSNMCSACGVRRYCSAMGGDLANTVPQPWADN